MLRVWVCERENLPDPLLIELSSASLICIEKNPFAETAAILLRLIKGGG